ncbi:MAG: hypothetical protein HY926_13840 [Elusimicrobia bacterium]|nr:hypothetical protein [Elusimicrobiota bacterium]
MDLWRSLTARRALPLPHGIVEAGAFLCMGLLLALLMCWLPAAAMGYQSSRL